MSTELDQLCKRVGFCTHQLGLMKDGKWASFEPITKGMGHGGFGCIIMKQGRDGQMPTFKNILSEAQIEAVSAFVLEKAKKDGRLKLQLMVSNNMMKSLIYTISLPLAALLGFGVHRAGLCTVKTVGEIFSTRKAYMLTAMLKTMLWVMAVSMPILLFLPGMAAPNRSYALTIAAISGGFLFGVGTAINGGCAFSTLGYLANGNLWILTTLIGYCLGVTGLSIMVPIIETGQALIPLLFTTPNPLIFTVLASLWLFLCREIFRLWKTRVKGRSWRLQWRRIQTWPRHLIGGALMGAGAVLVPGGNDTLMLKSLPGLSPHAIPVMIALFLGIGITLLLIRLLTGKTLNVVCTNDICQTISQFTSLKTKKVAL